MRMRIMILVCVSGFAWGGREMAGSGEARRWAGLQRVASRAGAQSQSCRCSATIK